MTQSQASQQADHCDVMVIGGGAAGLMAAYSAASSGRKTLLLEKNRKIGVKILMSGGTRCNITHDADWKQVAEAFGDQGRFLKHALASFSPDQVVEFFHRQHVPTKVESTGKVFPRSDKAIDVRDALVSAARSAGATIVNETAALGLENNEQGFVVKTSQGEYTCDNLIVTTGGQSYPGCGTTGDGYQWMEQLGHTINAPRPALVPLKIHMPWVRELTGVTVQDVKVSYEYEQRKQGNLRTDYRGSFLFTHFGCSGPVVLNVSRALTDPSRNSAANIVCDWLPDQSDASIRQAWDEARQSGGATSLSAALGSLLPSRLVESLLKLAAVPQDRRLSELSNKEAAVTIQQLKKCQLPVGGTRGFAKAEVTAGGVELSEIDSRTMQSKIVPGLHIAGELLDVDGPIGGYNFQAAFSTGWLAGQCAGRS